MATDNILSRNCSRLKRIAGGNDAELLENEMGMWRDTDINTMVDASGKSILHHAAWRGSIENVKLLIDYGANVNHYSVGEFSFGKTAIFFAVTRCRDDIVLFLLSMGASCKIINNKGQSVLSLASSHLQSATISAIRAHEENETCEWKNYRLTNSDGRQYGDLDPRFMDRNLLSTDVITTYSINPTTHISRRGNFARNNPGKSAEEKRRLKNKKEGKNKQPKTTDLSQLQLPDQDKINELIEKFDDSLCQFKNNDMNEMLIVLEELFEVHQSCRMSWLPELVSNINNVIKETKTSDHILIKKKKNLNHFIENFDQICTNYSINNRNIKLFRKFLSLITGLNPTKTNVKNGEKKTEKISKHTNLSIIDENSLLLLPIPSYCWVDDIEGLLKLRKKIEDCVSLLQMSHKIAYLAFDTEWCTDNKPPIQVKENIKKESECSSNKSKKYQKANVLIAIIQISIKDIDDVIHTWVVDALSTLTCSTQTNLVYADCLSDTLCWMWKTTIPIGFAIKNDIDKLQSIASDKLDSQHCIDIQKLAMKFLHEKIQTSGKPQTHKQDLPSLKHCVACCMGFKLNKEEQRSDWSQRPLSVSQLNYAALDATVLIPLLEALQIPQRMNAGAEEVPF